MPTVPTVVVAETYRGPRSARIASLLKTCDVETLDESLAREAGVLLANVNGSTTIDAIVVASASRRGDTVLTTDPDDLRLLAEFVKNVLVEAV